MYQNNRFRRQTAGLTVTDRESRSTSVFRALIQNNHILYLNLEAPVGTISTDHGSVIHLSVTSIKSHGDVCLVVRPLFTEKNLRNGSICKISIFVELQRLIVLVDGWSTVVGYVT